MKKFFFFFFISAFLLTLFTGFAVQLGPVKPRLYVLSVGVRAYKDSNLNLNYADKDAREVAAAFQKQISLYDVREVKVLVNQEAGKNAIRTALRDFQTKVNADDLFLFFFSGHGLEDRLVPYDFSRDDAYGTSLLKEDLKTLLEGMGCNYILLVDACHSGSLAKGITKSVTVSDAQTSSRRLYEELKTADKTQMILGSSASNQLSFECLSCQNGFFAEAILNVFANREVREASGITYRPDQDKDGLVSLYEFSSYMQDAVRIMTAEARKTNTVIEVQKVYSSVKTSSNLAFLQVGSGGGGAPVVSSFAPPQMVYVEGGWYKMGDTFGDGNFEERPVHDVLVSSFWMGKNEVTVGEFRNFIEETGYETVADKKGSSVVIVEGYSFNTVGSTKKSVNWLCNAKGEVRPKSEDNHPVIHVSWLDAIEYCNWLSKVEGLKPVFTIPEDSIKKGWNTGVIADWNANGYRLPTEAEWEYAARSRGGNYKYAWGNGNPKGNLGDESLAKYYPERTIWEGYNDYYVFTSPVGSFSPNDLGLNDMTGNVWEFCWDFISGSNYYQNSPQKNPTGPSYRYDYSRVVRGGSWASHPKNSRLTVREIAGQQYRIATGGFRLVKSQ